MRVEEYLQLTLRSVNWLCWRPNHCRPRIHVTHNYSTSTDDRPLRNPQKSFIGAVYHRSARSNVNLPLHVHVTRNVHAWHHGAAITDHTIMTNCTIKIEHHLVANLDVVCHSHASRHH